MPINYALCRKSTGDAMTTLLIILVIILVTAVGIGLIENAARRRR